MTQQAIIECVDVEEDLIGSLLTMPEQFPLTLMERLAPAMFWKIRHQWIYDAMNRLHQRGDEIDLATVSEELNNQGHLEEVNAGENYLLKLATRRFYSGAQRTMAAQIRRTAEARALLGAASEIAKLGHDGSQSIITRWSKAKRFLDVARPYEPNANFTFGADTFESYRQMIEDMHDNPTSYAMPVDLLMSIYGEAQPGELFGVVGPTGSGKSSWLSTVAEFAASVLGLRSAYIFTEMRLKKVLDRRMAKNSHIDYRRLKNPVEWTEGEQQMLIDAEARIMAWAHKLDYWHAPSPQASTLLANMRRMHTELGTTFFVIDHMNDVDVEEYDAGARNWVSFLVDLETFCNETGSILWTAAQTNRNDGKAYMVGQAFDHKMSLVMELQPKELETDFVMEYDGREYRYVAGKNSPVVDVYCRKNREGGPARGKLLFVGPRYLWVDVPADFDDGSGDPGAYDDVYRGGE